MSVLHSLVLRAQAFQRSSCGAASRLREGLQASICHRTSWPLRMSLSDKEVRP